MGVSPEHKDTKSGHPSGRSRRRRIKEYSFMHRNKFIMIICLSVLGIAVLAAGGYAWMGQKYKRVFFPNTMINGLNASGRSVSEIEAMITAGMDGYVLTLNGRNGSSEQIDGQTFGLHAEFDGTLQQILDSQKPLEWASHHFEGNEYTIETMMVYDEDQLKAAFDQLELLDESKTTVPADAGISTYQPGIGYQIIPEQQGTRLIKDVVWEEITGAILRLQDTVDLEELNAYVQPEITGTDERLLARLEEWNRYVNVTVKYQFGDQTEILDGDTIHTWLYETENHNVILSDEAVAAYVKTLGEKYNTAYTYKQFKTSYDQTVTIKTGNYGWRINQGVESAALAEIIRSGEGQTREPVYSQTAASHTKPDYGDTYVEINLTAQHLFFYKDGKLLVESDFVSGNESRGWATPAGAFPLTYKQRNATLSGENYSTPVSYWMPFNGNIGMHDAPWRNTFGGNYYKTSGSHGCINLPPAVAQTIYENITTGMPVLCYYLEGTESKTTAVPPTETQTQPAETTAAVTQPTEQPQESTANPAESTSPVETSPQIPETSSPAQEETTPASSESAHVPIPPDATTAPQDSQAGPGGEKTQQDTGVVDGPGM